MRFTSICRKLFPGRCKLSGITYFVGLYCYLRNIYHTGLLVTGSCIFVDNNPPYQDDAFKQFLNVEEMAQVL